ncbi:hypothetical protein ABIF90_007305 [Bradyrhizobium japonicum]
MPEGPVGGIARRFEVATESIAHLIAPFSGFLGGSDCSGDASSIASSTRNPPKAMQ